MHNIKLNKMLFKKKPVGKLDLILALCTYYDSEKNNRLQNEYIGLLEKSRKWSKK